ncbi:C2H2-type domain-containing protein [Balamuthia mandrillaris]
MGAWFELVVWRRWRQKRRWWLGGSLLVVLLLAFVLWRRSTRLAFLRRQLERLRGHRPPSLPSSSSSAASFGASERARSGPSPLSTPQAPSFTTSSSSVASSAALPHIRLSEVARRRVCCSTLGVIFQQQEGREARQDEKVQWTIEPATASTLRSLASTSDLYLITQCDDDETEQLVIDACRRADLFGRDAMSPHKVLFCSTSLGKVHIARQLDAYLFIDGSFFLFCFSFFFYFCSSFIARILSPEDAAVIQEAQRFFPLVALVSSSSSSSLSSSSASSSSSSPSWLGKQYHANSLPALFSSSSTT